MEEQIIALTQNGGSVTFSRPVESGNFLCVARSGDKQWEAEGKLPADALLTVTTQANRDTNRAANPHLIK